MKKVRVNRSGLDMLKAFRDKISDLSNESAAQSDKTITSACWIDVDGGFGDVGEVYTDRQLRKIWDDDHEYDPSMSEYASFDEWIADTKSNYLKEMPQGTMWVDTHDIMGGGRTELYSDADLREYYIDEHDHDPVLMDYKSFDDWYKDTTRWLEEYDSSYVESCDSVDVMSADIVEDDNSDVYMLMYYAGGSEGMESDEFGALCMFRANSLDDAKLQVADWNNLQVEDDSIQYYADYYNDYFEEDTDGVVYDSLSDWSLSYREWSTRPYEDMSEIESSYNVIQINKQDKSEKVVDTYETRTEANRAMFQNKMRDDKLGWDKRYDYQLEPVEGSMGRGSDSYFGETAARVHGQAISDALSRKKISKRRDKAQEPGGLIYEANALGIDFYELLEALEGMCADGRAREIDDSTYLVVGGEPHPVRGLFGATEDEGINASEDVEDKLYLTDPARWIAEMEQYADENPPDNGWEKLASKQVEDSDGFLTDYTLYHNTWDDSYACVFGDADLYRPEEGEFDWEGQSEDEAWEWFDSYEGFADVDDSYESSFDDIEECTVTGSTSSYVVDIVDWLSEHETAYIDATNYFDTFDLTQVSYDDLVDWISYHPQLSEDFVAKFGPISE